MINLYTVYSFCKIVLLQNCENFYELIGQLHLCLGDKDWSLEFLDSMKFETQTVSVIFEVVGSVHPCLRDKDRSDPSLGEF